MDIGASLWATAIQTTESGAAITKTRHIGCRWGYSSLVYETDSVMFPQAKATGLTVKDWQNLIMVNQFGKRFWDEGDGSYKFFNAAMAYHGDKTKLNGGGPIWAIFDADGAAREKWNTKPPNVDPDGWFFAADTLAELAGRIKNQYQKQPMPGAALTETVARYNSFVAEGVDKDFKKQTPMHKIEKPPFYAAWSTPILHDTLTGLRTNTDRRGDRHPRRGDPGPLLRGRVAGRLRPARPGALPRVRPHRRAARGEELGLRRMTADTAQTDAQRCTRRASRCGTFRAAVAAGERFSVKVGAKSSAGCALGGLPHRGARWRRRGGRRRAVSATRRGPAPTRCSGPRSSLRAPPTPGLVDVFGALRRGRARRAARGRLVAVQRRGGRAARAHADGDGRRGRRAGRGRHRPRSALSRHHRRSGHAPRSDLAKGRYELVVWKAGYDAPADAARRSTRSRGADRGARAAGGRSRRGLDGVSGVI